MLFLAKSRFIDSVVRQARGAYISSYLSELVKMWPLYMLLPVAEIKPRLGGSSPGAKLMG